MKILQRILITAFVLITTYESLIAQDKPSNTSIKGTVLDKSTGQPLELATIQVFSVDDSILIGGASTDKEGKFLIENLPEGNYNVKISYIGYNTAIAKDVRIEKNKSINLGTIKLEMNSESTEEIRVEDEAPIMTYEQGKKVYDVRKDLTAQNGTILDLLKNIPSVDVDNNGNVSLRGGGNVKILIDGKPSALLSNGTQILQNMPANIVEKIEIINNPSAKYEAEGISGIINIIMKQGEKSEGYSGNIKLNGGTEDKYNIYGSASLSKNKFNINGIYSFWNYSLPGITNIYRLNYSSSIARTIEQNFDWRYKGTSHYGSLSGDYDFDNFNNVSLVTSFFIFDRKIDNRNILNFYDASNNLTTKLDYLINDNRDGYFFDGTLTYTKKFEEKGRDFTAFINSSGRNENTLINYNISDNINNITKTKNESDFNFNFLNFQADYVHPLSETNKLETGIKSNFRMIKGDYKFYKLDSNTGNWEELLNKRNDADYKDLISAAYLNYSGAYKDFSYQVGLRSEHTYLDFSILNGSEKYNNKYIDLFPSVSLSQKLGIENQFQATYSRRINRPNLYLLNPFVEQVDEYTKRTGNPYINPEYINSFELGYTRSLNFAMLTLTGFFRNTKNSIQYLSYTDSTGIVLMKPDNRGTSNTYGLEFIVQGGLAKWWMIYGSVSYFNTNIFYNGGVDNFDKTYNAWSARISSNAAIPDLFDVQLTYFYYGKQETAQGSMDPFQTMNLSIQKSFFDKKLTIGLRINDLLNQQKFYRIASGSDFYQSLYQKTNSRAVFFTITFNFGEQLNSKSQKTAQKKQREIEGEIQNTGN